MESRNKYGLADLWWHLAATAITVLIMCTSMLAGRRLSTEKNTESCDWIPASPKSNTPPQLVDQVILVIIDALTPRVALGPSHALRKRDERATAAVAAAEEQREGEGREPPVIINKVSSADYIPRESAWFTFIRDELFERPANQSLAHGFFSVADAPTTTAQRTKAMVTGTIPVLLEAGTSFNSFSVEEDNLLEKLGGQVAVLGDDTWVRLFPKQHHWSRTHVFESFDVRDLHTVDNGILEHLNSVLRNQRERVDVETDTTASSSSSSSSSSSTSRSKKHPKLVIAHFLGVDHAGHQYNANDPHLFGKVNQLNRVLRNISQFVQMRSLPQGQQKHQQHHQQKRKETKNGVGEEEKDADLSNEDEITVSTLLLVMGDHGMTEGGDHGGSTPSETDTFLFSQVFPATRRQRRQVDKTAAPSFRREVNNNDSKNNNAERRKKEKTRPVEEKILSSGEILNIGRWFTTAVRREHCSTSRLCRITLPEQIHSYCKRAKCASSSSHGGGGDETPLTAIHQIDLVPTLAAVFGIPIPKQNLGRLAPELVLQALVSYCSDQHQQQRNNRDGDDDDDGGGEINESVSWTCTERNIYAALERLLKCNVRQLRRTYCTEFRQAGDASMDSVCREEEQGKNVTSASAAAAGEKTRTAATTSGIQEQILLLDLVAAQLTRAARDALTDVDVAALLIALFLGFVSGFSIILQYIFSCPSTMRRQWKLIVFPYAVCSSFPSSFWSPLSTLIGYLVVVVFLRFSAVLFGEYHVIFHVLHCKSDMALFVALPMLIVTWRALDGQRWLSQVFELMPLPRVSRRFINSAAAAVFLLFAVRLGVQMSNSFIVREDVASCALIVTLLLVCHHVQIQVVSNNDSSATIRGGRLFFFSPVLILGAICSFSLYLGRRTRDFESHFVEAESRAQGLQQKLVDFILLSSAAPAAAHEHHHQPASAVVRSFEEYLAQHGNSRFTAAFTFTRWLFFDSCFIHVLLFVTLGAILALNIAVNLLLSSSSSSSSNWRKPIRNLSWIAFFAVAFIWNVTVSNVTSLQAFLCQCAFLVLWVKWFPLSASFRHVVVVGDEDEDEETIIEHDAAVMAKRGGGGGGRRVEKGSSSSRPSSSQKKSAGFKRRLLHTAGSLDGLVLHLCGWLFFFASGSQCVFSTIDWNIAFVGVSNVNFVAGGLLMVSHTFRPFLLSLVVAVFIDQRQREEQREQQQQQQQQQQRQSPIAVMSSEERKTKQKKKEDGARQLSGGTSSEVVCRSSDGNPQHSTDTTSRSFFVVGLGATLIYLNSCFCLTMCYSMVRHRGHLMSWEVFFPRFAFEVIIFAISVLFAGVVQVLSH